MIHKFLLNVDEQERKLLRFCFEKQKNDPPYFEEAGALYVVETPDLQIEKIIEVLCDVYFEVLEENPNLAEMINNTILKLSQINNEIIKKY